MPLTEALEDGRDKLNECRVAERVITEAYDKALTRATSASVSRRVLELRGDHARRLELLADRIDGRAAPMPSESELEAIVTRHEGGGEPLDEAATIALLEELEDQALAMYRHGLALRDPFARDFFARVLLPAQQRTQAMCRSLRVWSGRDVDEGVAKLERCLQEERSAADTYDLVLKGVAHVGIHNRLQEILASHARRADQLREALVELGGEPVAGSGIRGTIAMTVQTAAGFVGIRTALAALEAGEDRLLSLYTEGLGGPDARARKIMDDALLEERRTHQLCKTLREYVKAPG